MHVVLPAYNEAANLPPLLAGLRAVAESDQALELDVILVDDGSSDGTAAAALRAAGPMRMQIVSNGRNLGLAKTFQRGLTIAARDADPTDVIVCMDADNSHLANQIVQMRQMIADGADVVIASRFRPGAVVSGVPWARRILSTGMSMLFRVVLPIRGVRDYSCGFRAYRAGYLQHAIARRGDDLFAGEGFACMVGILARLSRDGGVFREVPLILRYDQKIGSSKMKVGRTIARTLALLVRERLRG